MIQPHNNPRCATCGDELKQGEQTNCFTCTELEIARRYRQHNQIGEYRDTRDEDELARGEEATDRANPID